MARLAHKETQRHKKDTKNKEKKRKKNQERDTFHGTLSGGGNAEAYKEEEKKGKKRHLHGTLHHRFPGFFGEENTGKKDTLKRRKKKKKRKPSPWHAPPSLSRLLVPGGNTEA